MVWNNSSGFAARMIRAGTPTVDYCGHRGHGGVDAARQRQAIAQRGGASPFLNRRRRAHELPRILTGLALVGGGTAGAILGVYGLATRSILSPPAATGVLMLAVAALTVGTTCLARP